MHGSLNTADRYRPCPTCGDQRGLDIVLGKCTITSCADYFGGLARETQAPVPPRTRDIVEAERAVLAAARALKAELQAFVPGFDAVPLLTLALGAAGSIALSRFGQALDRLDDIEAGA